MSALVTVREMEDDVRLEVTAKAVHLCPHRDEVDEGTVVVAWSPYEATIELHSLCAYIESLADVRISHEGYVSKVREDVEEALAWRGAVVVSATFTTAGMRVFVTTDTPE